MVLLFLLVSAAPSAELADAIRAYNQLDYRGARATLLRVIDSSNLSDGNKKEAFAYLGRIHAVLGEPVRAQRRFEAVLALDPDYSVAWEESPKIREVFDRAQKERARKQALAAKRREELERHPPRIDPAVPPVARPSVARPPPVEKGPTSPPSEDEGSTVWRIVGGVGLTVALGVVVAILAVGSGGEEEPAVIPTATWRLP